MFTTFIKTSPPYFSSLSGAAARLAHAFPCVRGCEVQVEHWAAEARLGVRTWSASRKWAYQVYPPELSHPSLLDRWARDHVSQAEATGSLPGKMQRRCCHPSIHSLLLIQFRSWSLSQLSQDPSLSVNLTPAAVSYKIHTMCFTSGHLFPGSLIVFPHLSQKYTALQHFENLYVYSHDDQCNIIPILNKALILHWLKGPALVDLKPRINPRRRNWSKELTPGHLFYL